MIVEDVVVDTLFEDSLERFVAARDDRVSIVRDKRDDEVPYYTPQGYLVVRCRGGVGQELADELQRQMRTMVRVVAVIQRQ